MSAKSHSSFTLLHLRFSLQVRPEVFLAQSREAAAAYLNHPVLQDVRSNPAVASSQSQMWAVDSSLSAITRSPLPGVSDLDAKSEAVRAGGQ